MIHRAFGQMPLSRMPDLEDANPGAETQRIWHTDIASKDSAPVEAILARLASDAGPDVLDEGQFVDTSFHNTLIGATGKDLLRRLSRHQAPVACPGRQRTRRPCLFANAQRYLLKLGILD